MQPVWLFVTNETKFRNWMIFFNKLWQIWLLAFWSKTLNLFDSTTNVVTCNLCSGSWSVSYRNKCCLQWPTKPENDSICKVLSVGCAFVISYFCLLIQDCQSIPLEKDSGRLPWVTDYSSPKRSAAILWCFSVMQWRLVHVSFKFAKTAWEIELTYPSWITTSLWTTFYQQAWLDVYGSYMLSALIRETTVYRSLHCVVRQMSL